MSVNIQAGGAEEADECYLKFIGKVDGHIRGGACEARYWDNGAGDFLNHLETRSAR